MYTWFYGFSEEPFNNNPDSKFLFLTKTHQQTLDFLVRKIRERREFIFVLGEAGSGKTTLIQHMLDTLDKEVKAVGIFNTPISLEEVLENTLLQVGIPSGPPNRISLVNQLNDYLKSLPSDGTLVVIIDEAQDLPPEVMDELGLLLSPGTLSSRKLQIILVGQPELRAKVELLDRKELRPNAEIEGQIQPLNEEEGYGYIAHRLSRVGSDIDKVFTPEAITLICRYAKGNPRTINILGDNSFLIGYSLSKKKVDSDIVTQVLEDLDYIRGEEGGRREPRAGRKIRSPGTRAKSSFFRKMSYSLLALAAMGIIIFLGRTYLKAPEEQRVARFPIQLPSAKERVIPPSPEAKPGLTAKEAPKPVAEHKPRASAQGPERMPPAPSARETIGAQISAPKTQPEVPVKKTVVTKAGESIYTIAARTYRVANTSVVDHILESNPWIANPNKLLAGQTVRLPEINEQFLIIEAHGGTCRIRLGTFLKPEYSTFLKGQPLLEGKMIEIIPRKLPSGETWYRAVAGKFSTREEGLRVIRALKGKGLSPYFPGFKKSP